MGSHRGRFGRSLDIAAAIAGLVLAAPLLLLAGMLVRLGGPGPIIYKTQVRKGPSGKPFWIYKFRTISSGRRTPIGGFLHRTKFDDLPQLWNLLRGDTTFVESPLAAKAYVPLPAFPRLWDLLGLIFPPKFRLQIYTPAIEEDKADYYRAMRSYRSPSARRWVRFCFAARTALRLAQCLWVLGLDRLARFALPLLRVLIGQRG